MKDIFTMMDTDALERVMRRFENATIIDDPFRHLVVTDVFDRPFYLSLLENIPTSERLTQLKVPDGGISASRSIVDVRSVGSSFWNEFALRLGDGEFINSVLKRFRQDTGEEYHTTVQLVQDRIGYQIGPHTDIASKIMTILFYLPADASQQRFGTSICTTTDPVLIGTQDHHSWDRFEENHLVLFRPNNALAFCRTDDSFHAVRVVDEDVMRNTITVTVRKMTG